MVTCANTRGANSNLYPVIAPWKFLICSANMHDDYHANDNNQIMLSSAFPPLFLFCHLFLLALSIARACFPLIYIALQRRFINTIVLNLMIIVVYEFRVCMNILCDYVLIQIKDNNQAGVWKRSSTRTWTEEWGRFPCVHRINGKSILSHSIFYSCVCVRFFLPILQAFVLILGTYNNNQTNTHHRIRCVWAMNGF